MGLGGLGCWSRVVRLGSELGLVLGLISLCSMYVFVFGGSKCGLDMAVVVAGVDSA